MGAVTSGIRFADFQLSSDESAVSELFERFFREKCTTAVVRGAEPLGFDRELWEQSAQLGCTTMGLPHEYDAGGAGMVELCLVAEQVGRRLAPVPFCEFAAASRALALGEVTHGAALLSQILGDDAVVSPALSAVETDHRQLVPAGAIASVVVGLHDSEFVAQRLSDLPDAPPNLACAPLGWVTLDGSQGERVVLVSGRPAQDALASMVAEWRLLVGSALVGLAETALEWAVAHACEREAFGLKIGTFQAISHPLVDVAVALEGARSLTRRAAWFSDHEPEQLRSQIPKAFLQAARTAELAVRVGTHTLGGLGITVDADMQLAFRRAKGWPLVAGDPTVLLDQVGAELAGENGNVVNR